MVPSPKSGLRWILRRHPAVHRSYGILREALELMPLRWRYRRRRAWPLRAETGEILAGLRRDGIVVLPEFIPVDAVTEMRDVVDRAIDERRYRYGGGIGFETPPADITRIGRLNVLDATLHSRHFVAYALNELFVDVVNAYVGMHCVVSGIVAYRTQPIPDAPRGAFLWHYDNTPRQVKAICYLTEVDEDDGPLVFVKGTHRLRPVAPTFDETRIDEAEVPADGRVVCVGKPGTVVLIDSSGIHRATPNVRRHRDVVSAIYDVATRARRACFYNLPVPTQFLASLSPDQRRMLRLPEFVG